MAYLAAEALGPQNVTAIRMPYRASSPESLDHAQLVIDALGIQSRTVDITAAVDGMVAAIGDTDPGRKGNIMARCRMITLFDLSAKLKALPLGTGNKTERLLGYFTWHADDSPPVNPIGDLFKTQVWALARYVGVPGGDRRQARHAPTSSRDRPTRATSASPIARGDRDPPLVLLSGYTPAAIVTRGLHRGRGGAGAAPARLDPLEAAAADRGDGEPDGDRRVVSEAGGLLSGKG